MCKVQEIRIEKNLERKEIAKILGISVCNYCKKELEQLNFSLKQAKIIADYFEMTIEEIFFAK